METLHEPLRRHPPGRPHPRHPVTRHEGRPVAGAGGDRRALAAGEDAARLGVLLPAWRPHRRSGPLPSRLPLAGGARPCHGHGGPPDRRVQCEVLQVRLQHDAGCRHRCRHGFGGRGPARALPRGAAVDRADPRQTPRRDDRKLRFRCHEGRLCDAEPPRHAVHLRPVRSTRLCGDRRRRRHDGASGAAGQLGLCTAGDGRRDRRVHAGCRHSGPPVPLGVHRPHGRGAAGPGARCDRTAPHDPGRAIASGAMVALWVAGLQQPLARVWFAACPQCDRAVA